MIEPHQALGLVPTMRGIRSRADIAVNLVTGRQIELMHKRGIWIRPDRI